MNDTAAASAPRPTRAGLRWRAFVLDHAPTLSIAVFFVVVFAYFAVTADAFLTERNLLNLLRQSAPMLIVAVAMTFVITTGGIDLSVGSTLALVSALAAISLGAGLPWPIMVMAMLLLGAVIGAINGYFVAYERIPAFIVTLAMLSTVRGLALWLTKGFSIPLPREIGFLELGRGWLLGVPVPALVALGCALAGMLALHAGRYGRYVTAIGSNMEAIRRAGVNVRRHLLSVYILAGLAAALGGLVITARLGSGSSNAGVGFELEVIAAVVLGGTNLFGGRGTVLGTVLGALTIAVIGNGLILSHVSPFFTQIVTGIIILAAIWLNTRLLQRRPRA